MRAYNKSYISNTMGIVVVGMDFGDSLEKGGISIKIFSKISEFQG